MTVSETERFATVEVEPGGPVHGTIRPPGSKSLTNRALLCAAFAERGGTSMLTGALRSEDTEVMTNALRQVGCSIQDSLGGTVLQVLPQQRPIPIHNAEGLSSESLELYVANSGTTIRFLTAALAASGGNFRLHGVPRMHERPIGDLVEALGHVIDGSIQTESPGACPPVVIRSAGWNPGVVRVRGNVSSQYLSGIMMAAPISKRKVTIQVEGELVSRPYVEMTARVMRDFGADVTTRELEPSTETQDASGDEKSSGARDGHTTFEVHIGDAPYQAQEYAIEPDASAASYHWAMAAISGGRVLVEGLSASAMQGDVGFVDVLEKMGCQIQRNTDSIQVTGGGLRGVDVDMNAISDTTQTLSVVALFADGPTRVRGVAHNRFKETDRIGDLAKELRKLGARIEEHEDGLTIYPLEDLSSVGQVKLDTYHDHRMAMSFALLGLRIPNIQIRDPACTAKTYPNYFADLERLTGRSHRWRPADEMSPG